MKTIDRNRIIVGDTRTVLADLPADSVDCIVTSPPYFQLRNYQHPDQIGLEPSVDDYAADLQMVARGLARVLKPTGTFWLNLGDSYARQPRDGAPPKSLLLAPERVALLLVADGWTLRNKIVWSKPNPMPSPTKDRLSCTWEIVYCFARSRSYVYDLDAIRIPHRSARPAARLHRRPAWSVPPDWRAALAAGDNSGLDRLKAAGLAGHPLGKNPGDVWTVATAGYRGAHHAVYPERLIERPITVGCPERVCARCGQPWRRERYRVGDGVAAIGNLVAGCDCGTGWRPGIVLDPFIGSGTTAVVAERLGRDWLGIELNPGFAANAEQRIAAARNTKQSSAA